MKRRSFFIILILGIAAVLLISFLVHLKGTKDKSVITLYGNVDVRQVDLGFRVTGRVETMPYQEGDLVEPGALMATLEITPYNDQVEEARANIETVRRLLENADLNVQRREGLVDSGGVSREDYDNTVTARDVFQARLLEAEAALKVALTNLQETHVYCPNEGTILTRIREPGTVVNVADPVYTLSLLSPVWIRAFIPEEDLGVVYPGMPAEVYTDTKGGPSYKGHVGFISPVAEFTPKTVETTELRTDLVYRLRIIADNPDKGLRQGMPVTVKLRLKEKEKEPAPEKPIKKKSYLGLYPLKDS